MSMLDCFFSDAILEKLSGNFDDDIQMLKSEYAACANTVFAEFYETLIFRVYRAKFLIAPKMPNFRYKEYVDSQSQYFETCNELVEKLFDQQKAEQFYADALKYVAMKDYASAGASFYASAIEGNVNAQYNYGVSVYNGEVGEPDYLESAFWYLMASLGGNAKAMSNLGIQYRNGVGVKQNLNQMMYWYAKGAQMFMPSIVHDVGLVLANEEVEAFAGNASIGRAFLQAEYRLDEPDVREFVTDNTEQIIEALGDPEI